MATILTKKSDTASAVPVAGDLTNSTGGAELAVNTADKRLFAKNSGGTVVEIGTNPTVIQVDNININGNALTSTDTNGNIDLTPNGTGEVNITKVDIDSGTIDNTAIGGATPAAGAFTTLSASSTLSVTGAGTIQGLTVGRGAGAVSTNTAAGASALAANTTGGNNVAVGGLALASNTSSSLNTAVGYNAMNANNGGTENSAFGVSALALNTTGNYNTALGRSALVSNTTASGNTAVGYQAGYSNTTATDVAALGYRAAYNNTTALGTVAIGAQAGLAVTTGNYNVFVGPFAGQGVGGNITGAGNTAVGPSAGASLTTGSYNSFFGPAGQINQGAGGLVTTGSKNTIIGAYNGNQGGLDIRTADGYIVLSDGDGNPRAFHNATDWALSPTYRTYLTRANNGGNDGSTGASGNFFKIGTWHVSGQGARATLRIAGATGFSNGVTTAGETVIFLVYENSNDVEGFYYSLVGGSSTSVNAVAVKNTAGAVEVWVKTGAFASTAVFPDCVFSRWEGVNSDTGSTSTPSGATLLDSYFRYLDSGASNSAVTLNRNGIGIGDATPSSGTGITFPATQNASSNANTLDDYEEGDWTPTISGAGTAGTASYVSQQGRYTKIGRLVTIEMYINGTWSSAPSDTVQIGGLPFTSGSATVYPAVKAAFGFMVNEAYAYVGPSSNVVNFGKTGGIATNLTGVSFVTEASTTEFQLHLQLTYSV